MTQGEVHSEWDFCSDLQGPGNFLSGPLERQAPEPTGWESVPCLLVKTFVIKDFS